MNAPTWRHSEPLPQPTRHRMRGRTDFEDSLISARREEQAQEKRRFQALNEALRARGIASDPDGHLFRAAQQKAIAERRADNARLAALAEPESLLPGDFTVSQLDAWDDAAEPAPRPARRSPAAWLAGLLIVSGLVGAVGVVFPDVLRGIVGA